jgi:hypothetical protein
MAMHDEGVPMQPRTRVPTAFRGTRLGAKLWFGLILLLLGILWTLDNLRYLDADEILDWWPLALIGFGVVKLLGLSGRAQPIAGTLWLLAGGVLLAHNQRVLPWGLGELWPVALVVLGGSLVWRSLRGSSAERRGGAAVAAGVVIGRTGGERTSSTDPNNSTVSGFALWSGLEYKPTSQEFRGGDFTAIMGGGEMDLRGAKPVPGGAVIEVFLMMGGLDIYVPPHWTIVNELYAVMGGIEDSRKSVPPDSGDVLILKGVAIMGGVEIQN